VQATYPPHVATVETMMIWTKLSKQQQDDIVSRAAIGESIWVLAEEYDIKESSLERKLRLLRSENPPSEKIFNTSALWLDVNEPKRIFVYSDAHFGMEDRGALNAAIKVAEMFQPEIIVNLGDTLDCYSISKFKKDPGGSSLQSERDAWSAWATKLNSVCADDVQRYIIKGNHEARFETFLMENPGIADLDEMSVDSLLMTDALGYHSVVDAIYVNADRDELYPNAQLYFLHGSRALKHSGSSTRAASDMYAGASTIVGHAHRSAMVTQRTGRGISKSYEVGTLASLMPDYMFFPNWSQSILTGVIMKDFHEFQLHVIDRGRVCYGGNVIGG